MALAKALDEVSTTLTPQIVTGEGNEVFHLEWDNLNKITTNIHKFKIIPIAQYKTEDIIADGRVMAQVKEGKILGQKTTTRGIVSHNRERINLGKVSLTKLQKYKNYQRT